MSESIFPWISAYFLASGEEHGADLSAIPIVTKKRKVQLVEFLTWGRDEIIWARVSDKECTVPIRFNREAVEEYTKLSRSHITEDKNAIISISNFKPFFARIPQAKGRMSEGNFLALECNSAMLVGGRGEPRFGRPEPLEANPDLKEWSEGLRQDGGAGNCLKNRKQATLEKMDVALVIPEPKKPIEVRPSKKPVSTNQAKAVAATKAHSFKEIWSISKKLIFRRPPDDVASVLASMKVDGDEESNPDPSRQMDQEIQPPRKRRRISALALTPSLAASQSSSQTRSATPFSEAEWPPSELQQLDTPPSSPKPPASLIPASSSPLHPTPAQRLPRKPTARLPPSPASPLQHMRPSNKQNTDTLSSSHPPISSHVTLVHESMLVPSSTESPPTHTRREVTRKVPRPPQPFKSDRLLPEPIILAPDSDLSLSYSQSQTQSQSQSQSQPVVLSQLSQLRRKPLSSAPPDQDQPRNSPTDGREVDASDNEDSIPHGAPADLSGPHFARGDGEKLSSQPVSPSGDVPRDNSLFQDSDDPQMPQDTAQQEVQSPRDGCKEGTLNTPSSTSQEDEELDPDDAQTHIDLFGSKPPNRLSRLSNGVVTEDTSPTTRGSVSSEERRSKSRDGPSLSAPRGVQHDPRAWAAPSFQTARKKARPTKVKPSNSQQSATGKASKVHVPTPSSQTPKTTTEEGQPSLQQASSRPAIQRTLASRAHVSLAQAGTQRGRTAETENEVHANPEDRQSRQVHGQPGTLSQRSTQRSRTSENDMSMQKKRKRDTDADALTEVTKDEENDNNAQRKKQKLDMDMEIGNLRNLKEFINVKLVGIPLENDLAVVSWEMLYGILVGTARDRLEEEMD